MMTNGEELMDASPETNAEVFAQQADQVRAQLRARLTDEEYRLARQFWHLEELALVATYTATEQRLLEALVAHLPEHAVAIRAVINHVWATQGQCDTLERLRREQHQP
jgi:hypothetical protein